jgi:predicted nucleic acid-binding protein
MEATQNLLNAIRARQYLGCISVVVLEEIADAPPEVRHTIDSHTKGLELEVAEETAECIALAKAYLNEGIFPVRFGDDARHVAIATLTDADALVSWNFRHLVNVEKRRKIAGINLLRGYRSLDIVSPLEVAHGT